MPGARASFGEGWDSTMPHPQRAACLDLIVASGGEIVRPIGGDAPEITARFRDREEM